ncbi:MAG: hypothetical protein ABL857_07430 [Rickettsiales bacterium]|jgi:hypothetical protein
MNRAINPTIMLIPHEMLGQILALFLVLGGICMVVGARKAATGLISIAIALPFITVVVEAFFNEFFAILPPQFTQLFAWLVLGLVYLLIFGTLMSFLFGQRVWDQAKGQLLADAIRGVLRLVISAPLLITCVVGLVAFLWWASE